MKNGGQKTDLNSSVQRIFKQISKPQSFLTKAVSPLRPRFSEFIESNEFIAYMFLCFFLGIVPKDDFFNRH